jgi:hypothetical protein
MRNPESFRASPVGMPRAAPARRSAPPEDPEAPARARDDRRRRALEEALDVQERTDRPYRSFEVRNPVHSTHYRVLGPEVPGILLCPCPDFGRRDVGTCKHVEAVLAYLTTHPEAPETRRPVATEPWWERIEAQLRKSPGAPLTDLRSLWAPGRVLTGAPGP